MSLIKKISRISGYSSTLCFVLIMTSCSHPTQEKNTDDIVDVVHYFAKVDTVTSNPSKGWMTFQHLPGNEPRFPGTVAYYRFKWVDLEPSEGVFDWEPIDNALKAWSKKGRNFAFRISTTNPRSAVECG